MAEISEDHIKKCKDLAARSFYFVNEEKFEKTLDVAKKLEELKYTAAFEIAGLAYLGMGEHESAVETFECGVVQVPSLWTNWSLLGDCRSDLEDYDGANEAYGRALECSEVDVNSIRLNQAAVAAMRGNSEESLTLLDLMTDLDYFFPSAAIRVGSLRGLGRLDEALTLADECLDME